MKKIFQLVVLALFLHNSLRAQQDTLFYGPDTVCVFQPVKLTSRYANQNSYYWGFCSGYLANPTVNPTGTNMGNSYGFNNPGNIDIVKDIATGNYYGFVVNTASREFLRLNYGGSLNNIPTVTNFGDMTKGLPINPTSLFIVRDTSSGYWFIFVSGGLTAATSTMARIDFGPTLSNPTPNIANFGNLFNMFNGPRGIFVAQDANMQWYGYVVNHNSSQLLRLEFSYNISNTPLVYNMGNPTGVLNQPSDMAAIYDYGNWYFFVTNMLGNTISRINIGPTLNTGATTPTATNIFGATGTTNFDGSIVLPSSISINRDCGGLYAFVTDSFPGQLVCIEMLNAMGPVYTARNYPLIDVTVLDRSTGVSSIIRDYDNLYAFICNAGDNSLTKISMTQCHNSSIQSFGEVTPPSYYYDTPGTFNVYYVINEGLPNVQVACKTIQVMPKPPKIMSGDKTICEGETTKLWAISYSTLTDSMRWTNGYNADTTYLRRDSVKVWPDYNTWYGVISYYPDGCITTDSFLVRVSKVYADAGPDRTIFDGSSTVIGGPGTSTGGFYHYYWQPYQYLSDTNMMYTASTPPYDMTYVLTVSEFNDDKGCVARDTVVVHVECEDLIIPNAFSPGSIFDEVNKFGIINNQITHLNYFRIFDRWGIEVFETTDPNHRWDGTYSGQPAPEGVYVWEADGYCLDGVRRYTKKGNVTLLR